MFDQNYVKECFKNHKATVKYYDNITVLDFKNPNSNEYRIRFFLKTIITDYIFQGILGNLLQQIFTI